MKKPDVRQKLIDEAKEAGGLRTDPSRLHPLGHGERPDFDLDRKRSLQQIADDLGTRPSRGLRGPINRIRWSRALQLLGVWRARLENQWRYMQLPHTVPMLGGRWRTRGCPYRLGFADVLAERIDQRTQRVRVARSDPPDNAEIGRCARSQETRRRQRRFGTLT